MNLFKSIPLWLFVISGTLFSLNHINYILPLITGVLYLSELLFNHRERISLPAKSASDSELAKIRNEIERVKLETSLQDVKNEKARRAESPNKTALSGYRF